MRAALDSELTAAPKRLLEKAEAAGWVTVATIADSRTGRSTCVRGRRRHGGRFVVTYLDGKVELCYWWSSEHRATVKGYRYVERETKLNSYSVDIGKKPVHDPELDEVVEWRSEQPAPVRVTVTQLIGVGGKTPRAGLLDAPLTQE